MIKSKHLLLTEGFNSTPQLYASQTRTSFIHDLWLSIRKKDLLKLFVCSFKDAFFEEEVFSLLSWNIWEVVFCLVSEITGTFATFNTIIFFTSRSEIMFSLQDVKEEREEWKWKRKPKKTKNSKGLVKLTVRICNGLYYNNVSTVSTQVLFCCCKQCKQRTRTKPVTFNG